MVNWLNCTYFNRGILEIPSQTLFWEEAVIQVNASTKNNKINFVIFPYPNGGWAAQCVAPSLKKLFDQRIPFPRKWAGETDKLPKITGIEGATFCHNGCFFIRANSKKAIIQMCVLATNLAKWRRSCLPTCNLFNLFINAFTRFTSNFHFITSHFFI